MNEVWVLLEYPEGKRKERTLYGVFASEEGARADYGEIRPPYDIEIIRCWVRP